MVFRTGNSNKCLVPFFRVKIYIIAKDYNPFMSLENQLVQPNILFKKMIRQEYVTNILFLHTKLIL